MTEVRGGLPVSAQQARIVDHVLSCPVTVVSAGAGSGKTHTTVAAVLQLLQDRRADLDTFVLITFTNKAADSLRGRLEEVLVERGREATDPIARRHWRSQHERLPAAFIGTIHSFCSQLIRTFGYDERVARDASITTSNFLLSNAVVDTAEAHLNSVNPLLLQPPLTWREYELRQFITTILEYIRNRGLDTREVLARTQQQTSDTGHPFRTQMASLVADSIDRYQELKFADQLLDATDLLERTAALLTGASSDRVLSAVTQHYRWLFVDEFQDTDRIQKRIVDALKPHLNGLLVVGDRKQSIYGFRAADVSMLGEIAEESDTELLSLSISRRPTPILLRCQNALFKCMSDRYPDLGEPLDPREEATNPVDRIPPFMYIGAGQGSTWQDRANSAAGVLCRLLKSEIQDPETGQLRPVRPADIAILFRGNQRLRDYESSLQSRGLPVRADTGGSFFQQPEIVSTHHMLRLILYYPNDAVLTAALRTPYLRGVNLSSVEQYVLQYRPPEGDPITDGLDSDYPDIAGHLATLRTIVRSATVPQILARLYELFRIREYYLGTRDAQAADNLEKLRELARGLGKTEQALTLRQFSNWLQLGIESGRQEGEAEAIAELPSTEPNHISMLTIHRAKGLEWPIVIIPEVQSSLRNDRTEPKFLITPDRGLDMDLSGHGVCTGSPRWSQLLASDRLARIEEEMRIFYVGVTRAQHTIILVGSSSDATNPPDNDYYSWRDEIMRARPKLQALGSLFSNV